MADAVQRLGCCLTERPAFGPGAPPSRHRGTDTKPCSGCFSVERLILVPGAADAGDGLRRTQCPVRCLCEKPTPRPRAPVTRPQPSCYPTERPVSVPGAADARGGLGRTHGPARRLCEKPDRGQGPQQPDTVCINSKPAILSQQGMESVASRGIKGSRQQLGQAYQVPQQRVCDNQMDQAGLRTVKPWFVGKNGWTRLSSRQSYAGSTY